MSRPRRNYGCLAFILDVILVCITGGLWLIWIFVPGDEEPSLMYLFFYDPHLDMLFIAHGTVDDLVEYGMPHAFDTYIYFIADITEVSV